MSIAVLTQVYDEARRLAVAGSAVAGGDFRLKKLLPALDQAGAKAPVFAKVAGCARAVIDGPDETSAESLLELTSLVTAVLYTQGETGLAGELKPIETVDLGGAVTQTTARVLKPLLEALSSTGSGRLELVKDAHARGAFRDLRLVQPALDGLDDPYPEIADFLAENVLSAYGTAIMPGLRAKYHPKGAKGDARRLKLMHAIDSAGTRELVKQVLEAGSKEVKVAAIECLGGASEDLNYLIEQVSAKAREVRAAMYKALATLDDPKATAALAAAIVGKEVDLAASAIARSKNDRLTDLLVAEIEQSRSTLPGLRDKTAVSETARRLCHLITALPNRVHRAADTVTLDLFARRDELTKVKGADLSGSDVVDAVFERMAGGPKSLQVALAHAHAELEADKLSWSFRAARRALPAAEVFESFSVYLATEERGSKSAISAKRQTIIILLGGGATGPHLSQDDSPRLDARWLDLAVRMRHVELAQAVGWPGHAPTEAFLQEVFDERLRTCKTFQNVNTVLNAMVRLRHPRATDALIACFEKNVGEAKSYLYLYSQLIPDLPKSAIPRLEAVVPKLKDREGNQWLAAIQQLRDKD
jgi:hypothetical protein